MERSDDDIQEFINGMWPDLGFTVVDLKKPNGERFRHLLMLFLELFYGKVSFAKINFAVFTRNPEMFSHNELGLSLFREVNTLLRKLAYHNFRFNDIISPTPAAVREVLSVLLNLATFMESNTETIEEAKAMVQSLAQRQREGEKRLVEEKKHLNKCKQLAEERKMHEMELHDLVTSKKEELRQIQKEVQQQEEEANIALKRQQILQQKLEQSEIILSQVESERSKASEEVVLDPESLFCELNSLKKEKQILLDEYNSYKERLPALEQQLRDRTEKLQEDTEMMNQLAQLKACESKVKAEMNEQEALLRKEEKKVSEVEAKLYREQCTIESKKRILDQNMQEMELERNLAEEELSKLRLDISDEAKRKQYQEAHILNLEERRHVFLEQLEVKKRGLEEIKVVSLEIDSKFQQQIAIVEKKELEQIEMREANIQLMINSFQSGKSRRK